MVVLKAVKVFMLLGLSKKDKMEGPEQLEKKELGFFLGSKIFQTGNLLGGQIFMPIQQKKIEKLPLP